jgi:hypothetical protein
MNLGLLTLVTFLAFVFSFAVQISPLVWALLLIMNIAAMMFAIPGRQYNKNLLRSVLLVPVIFFRMIMLMLRLKGANKSFIHTPHGQTQTHA